jgi:hypothetical protein
MRVCGQRQTIVNSYIDSIPGALNALIIAAVPGKFLIVVGAPNYEVDR